MRTNQTTPKDIDEYIAGFPNNVQEILEKIRITIRKAAPDAQETIKYQMPTFALNGNRTFSWLLRKHRQAKRPSPDGAHEWHKPQHADRA